MNHNGFQNMSYYFESLFRLKECMEGKSYTEQDEIWQAKYEMLRNSNSIQSHPWEYLAMIHPDFYYSDGRYIGRNLSWKENNFTKGITNFDQCQHVKYTKVECIFNTVPSVRGKCHADHIWPNSLGGPSILENRLILCKYHNTMKSNNISDFFWVTPPGWILKYLNQLARLK